MIRLLRRLGRFPKGTETDFFDDAAEAAFVLDGTAEPVESAEEEEPGDEPGDADYGRMKKDDLLKLAMARGLEVSPRAKVSEIIDALETGNDS